MNERTLKVLEFHKINEHVKRTSSYIMSEEELAQK